MVTRRPPVGRVWWTHLALGLIAGGSAGALSMAWFGAVAIPFAAMGADDVSWFPLFIVVGGVVGAVFGLLIAMTVGTALWTVNRVELGPRWYPPVGAAIGAVLMWAWSSELGVFGQLPVAAGSACICWRFTRVAEDVFSEYRQ